MKSMRGMYMDIFQKEGAEQLRIKKWEEKRPGLYAGFTTRNGGKSNDPYDTFNMGLHVQDEYKNVIDNREHLGNLTPFPVNTWVSGQQTHQTNLHIVRTADKGKGATDFKTSIPATDGLITNEKGILNTAFFADCVPLFFFDQTSGYIGIAHAGWKGTVGRIGEKMVENLTGLGVDVSSLLVAIGPCITAPYYEVDEHVISKIDSSLRQHVAEKNKNNRYLLDLKQLNKKILRQSGISETNIDMTDYCTYQHKETFFSHRRDDGKTGRMLGFIGYQS